MLWLEMSRVESHGGGTWGFTKSLWSPSHEDRTRKTKWAFWETLLDVKAGNIVLHLRGIGQTAAFTGFSTAETDGYETTERPPFPSIWNYASTFYRVILSDYNAFPEPINLRAIFSQQDDALREYFNRNAKKSRTQKLKLFYVIQSGRIQCLNGAYLSEVDDELAGILLGSDYTRGTSISRPPAISVETGQYIRELKVRTGQGKFSDQVRDNYGSRCCFPNCSIAENRFLVGSHIARWSDVPELRGKVSNGLCFCLMHDKAFESGCFTVDRRLQIAVNRDKTGVMNSAWCKENLLLYNGIGIRRGKEDPSEDALHHHWARIDISSEQLES
jgi:putative restriction endonuclease